VAPTPGRTDIAVLPFQNLSAEGPNAYFAGGLHEELLTQLAKVAALKVISRTSVMGYSATTKPLRQIAAEVGVGSVVEGSVQVAGNRLRVNVQLIDAATDEHLWAERYDRTLDDAFAIQSDVAQRIVAAVGATLGSDEKQGITAVPTTNAEAYRLFLQGEDYRRRPGFLRQNLEIAQRFYEQSLDLDPGLALAHASLSMIHGEMYWAAYDPVAARAAHQRDEAQTALRLAPELPQARIAMGLAYYQGRGDWARALEEFRTALRALPNDANVWAHVAWAQRRLGNWAAVDSAYQQAVRLDPRNADVFEDLGGWTYLRLRRYADAVRACDRALVLAPDLTGAAFTKGQLYVLWKGDLDMYATDKNEAVVSFIVNGWDLSIEQIQAFLKDQWNIEIDLKKEIAAQ
jgi:serine/threonine-protein kinase